MTDDLRRKAEEEALKITGFHDFENEKGLNMEIADHLEPLYRRIGELETEVEVERQKAVCSWDEHHMKRDILRLQSLLEKAIEGLKWSAKFPCHNQMRANQLGCNCETCTPKRILKELEDKKCH